MACIFRYRAVTSSMNSRPDRVSSPPLRVIRPNVNRSVQFLNGYGDDLIHGVLRQKALDADGEVAVGDQECKQAPPGRRHR